MTATRELIRDVDRFGGWLRVGALRGAAIGVLTPVVCALVGIVVVLTAEPEPLPAGTTTTSTQTPMQALAGLVLVALYVAIAASFGLVVGAAVGAATAGLAGALDMASARRLPAWLLRRCRHGCRRLGGPGGCDRLDPDLASARRRRRAGMATRVRLPVPARTAQPAARTAGSNPERAAPHASCSFAAVGARSPPGPEPSTKDARPSFRIRMALRWPRTSRSRR